MWIHCSILPSKLDVWNRCFEKGKLSSKYRKETKFIHSSGIRVTLKAYLIEHYTFQRIKKTLQEGRQVKLGVKKGTHKKLFGWAFFCRTWIGSKWVIKIHEQGSLLVKTKKHKKHKKRKQSMCAEFIRLSFTFIDSLSISLKVNKRPINLLRPNQEGQLCQWPTKKSVLHLTSIYNFSFIVFAYFILSLKRLVALVNVKNISVLRIRWA